jgi:hypothetical protein
METIIEKPKDLKSTNGFNHAEHGVHVNGQTLKYDGVVEILLLIRRNAFMVLMIGLAFFCMTFFVYNRYYNYYISTVAFLFDDSNPAEITTSDPERFVLAQMYAVGRNRMALLVFSDEMVSRLDNKLDLAKHYHVDRNNPYYKSELISRLRSKITIKRQDPNTVYIEVKDKDRVFPSQLANELYFTLVELNKEVVMKNIRYKLNIYENNIKLYKAKKNDDMTTFMEALNRLPGLNKSEYNNPDNFFYLKRDLTGMFINYSNSSMELKNNELIFSLTSDVMRDTSLQAIYLINKAYPNAKKESTFRVSSISFLVAMSAISYYLIMVFFFGKYKHYAQVLLKRKLPEFHH